MKATVFQISPKNLAVLVTVLMISSILYGVFLAEPWQSRAINSDMERVDDLNDIDFKIKEYWNVKGTLPSTLEDLDNGSYFLSEDQKVDSEGLRYSYTMVCGNTYELCSEFYLSSDEGIMDDWRDEQWEHPSGYHCFQFDDLEPFIGNSNQR